MFVIASNITSMDLSVARLLRQLDVLSLEDRRTVHLLKVLDNEAIYTDSDVELK